VHFDPGVIGDLGPHLVRSAVPVVIDHMGRVDASLGIGQPDFELLRRLLDRPFVSG
jgi:2-pyrone-4,6-dicarboxylate lactonase